MTSTNTSTNTQIKHRLFALPAGVLKWGFIVAAAGACLDYRFPYPPFEIQQVHAFFICALIAALAVTDRDPMPIRRRAWLAVGGVAGALVLAFALRPVAAALPQHRGLSAERMARLLFHSPAPWLWGAAWWLGAPLLLGRESGKATRTAMWALMAYGTLCLASAAVSQSPETSLSLFYRERAIPFAVLLAWMRAAGRDPALRSVVARATVWMLVGLVSLAAWVGLADVTGSAPLRKELVVRELVFQEQAPQVKTVPERRLIFPMRHFNRTAYLAMFAALALLTAACGPRASGIERWRLAGLVPALVTMVLSFTRGVTAAALAGLCAWAALVSRKALAVIVVGCLAGALLLPAARREYFLSIFEPSTYRLDVGGMTSMKLRQFGWRYGVEAVRTMPVTGVGYGTPVVRAAYERHVEASGNTALMEAISENAAHVHMHNMWLEIAVESGVAALLCFLVFTGARWWVLARAFWRSAGQPRRRAAAWIAFELSLTIAGTIFYMLKQNFGMLHFFVWGFMLVELDSE